MLKHACALVIVPMLSAVAFADEPSADRWRIDLAVGPSLTLRPLEDCSGTTGDATPPESPTYAAVVPHLAVAVTADRRGSVILPLPSFETISAGTFIFVPVGFRYEIPIRDRLSLTFGLELGVAEFFPRGGARQLTCSPGDFFANQNDTMAFVTPSIGVEYAFAKRWHLGFEPFSMPALYGDTEPNRGKRLWTLRYRLLFSAGVRF